VVRPITVIGFDGRGFLDFVRRLWMRRIFRVVAPLVAASLIAGCAGGGTPAAVPATAGTTSTSASRSALDFGFGFSFGQTKTLSATPASLTFASATAAAQTETIQQPNGFFGINLRGAKVVVSPANLVTVTTAPKCTIDSKHHWNGFFWLFWTGFFWNLWDGNDRNGRDCDDGDAQTLVYSVAPQTVGTGTITFSTGDGYNDGSNASVVVPVTVTAPAPGPLTVTVTPAGNLISCTGTLTVPTCPGTSLPVLNAVAGTPELPQFTLAITETNYTGVFTVTDTDTSCGIAPAIARLPTVAGSQTVQIALTQTGFSTIVAIRATPSLSAASCDVLVADNHGGSQTVTLSWQLGGGGGGTTGTTLPGGL